MYVSVEPLRVSEEVELAPEHDLDEQLESDAEYITGERQNECNVCGWKKFRRYFRHPYLRIFIAVGKRRLNLTPSFWRGTAALYGRFVGECDSLFSVLLRL